MTEFSAIGGSTTDTKAAAQAVSYLAAPKPIRRTPDQQACLVDGVLTAAPACTGIEATILSAEPAKAGGAHG